MTKKRFLTFYTTLTMIIAIPFLLAKCSESKEQYIYFNDTISNAIDGKIIIMKTLHKSHRIAGFYVGVDTEPTYLYRIHQKDTLSVETVTRMRELLKWGDSIHKNPDSDKVEVYRNSKLYFEFYLEE